MAVVAAGLGAFVLHGPVDADSLADSVTNETGAPADCVPTRAPSEWRCSLSHGSDGPSTYRLRVTAGTSCWKRVTKSGVVVQGQTSGSACVHLWQWS